MEDIVDYKKALDRNSYWLKYEAARLRVLARMTDDPACKEIMAVYQCDKDSQEELYPACANVWEKFGGEDCGCSAGMSGQMGFIARMVPLLVERHQVDARKALEAQIEKTKLDLERLEAQREVK